MDGGQQGQSLGERLRGVTPRSVPVVMSAVAAVVLLGGCSAADAALGRVQPNAPGSEALAPGVESAAAPGAPSLDITALGVEPSPTPKNAAPPGTAPSNTAAGKSAAPAKPASKPTPTLAPVPGVTTVDPPLPAAGAVARPGTNCNINYNPCVPNDRVDADCGNVPGQDGPSWVMQPVRITGTDVYHLDGLDKDGVACERPKSGGG